MELQHELFGRYEAVDGKFSCSYAVFVTAAELMYDLHTEFKLLPGQPLIGDHTALFSFSTQFKLETVERSTPVIPAERHFLLQTVAV